MKTKQLQRYFVSNYAKLMLYNELSEGSIFLARSICRFIIESAVESASVSGFFEKFYSFRLESILRNGKGRIIADNFELLEDIKQNQPEIFEETASQIFEMLFRQEIDFKNYEFNTLVGENGNYQSKNFTSIQNSCEENILSEYVAKNTSEGYHLIRSAISIRNKSGKELHLGLILPATFYLVPHNIYFAEAKGSDYLVEFDIYNGHSQTPTEESFSAELGGVVTYGNLSKKDGTLNLLFSVVQSWITALADDSLVKRLWKAKKENIDPEEINKLELEYSKRLRVSYSVALRLGKYLEEKGFKLF